MGLDLQLEERSATGHGDSLGSVANNTPTVAKSGTDETILELVINFSKSEAFLLLQFLSKFISLELHR